MERVENVEKITDDLYKYDLIITFPTDLEALNREKAELEARIVHINYIISEIEKL